MFRYCPQCGWICNTASKTCFACAYMLKVVPVEFLSASGNMFVSNEARNKFINTEIESGAEFQPELAQKRDELLSEKEAAHQTRVAELVAEHQKTSPTHKCPVCSSQNLSRISTVGKVVKIAAIGVWGAGDLGKQWHCNSCGYRF